jgi:ketosteroid isomerase-like protein
MIEASLLAGFNAAERELLVITWSMVHAIQTGDAETYARLTSEDLSCYEDVCAHRIDGLEFHTELIKQMAGGKQPRRFDILSPRVQLYGDTGIVCYTRLITYDDGGAPLWRTYNESRVFVKLPECDGAAQWKMVHFHRSPV